MYHNTHTQTSHHHHVNAHRHHKCLLLSQYVCLHSVLQANTGVSAHQYHSNQTLRTHDAQSERPCPRRHFSTPRTQHWACHTQQVPQTLHAAYPALTCVPVYPMHSMHTYACCLSVSFPALAQSSGRSSLPSTQFPDLMGLSQMPPCLAPRSLLLKRGPRAKPRRP